MFDVIKSDLAELDEGLTGAVASSVELVTEVGTHLVSAGGKRIRPALCLLAAHGGPDFELKRVLPLAESLELIHTASLVHDDVLDEADTRRGQATANAKWNNQVAILSGDYIFARAFGLIADSAYGEHVSKRMAELVCNLRRRQISWRSAVNWAVWWAVCRKRIPASWQNMVIASAWHSRLPMICWISCRHRSRSASRQAMISVRAS